MAHGFIRIGRVHLIGFLIARERARRPNRIAERPIIAGGVFRRIAEDQNVLMPLGFERAAHRANAAIHHIGRADNVRASLCLREGHFDQGLNRAVIYDNAIFNKTVVAIDIVRIKRNIRHDCNIRGCILNGAGRLIGEVVWVPRLSAVIGLEAVIGVGKEANRWNSKALRMFRGLCDLVDRAAHHARHRAYRVFDAFAVAHENGPDQIGWG